MVATSLYSNIVNNKALSCMHATNSILRMNSLLQGYGYISLAKKGHNMAMSVLNDSLMYRLALALDEAQRKRKKENIKRAFSIFA